MKVISLGTNVGDGSSHDSSSDSDRVSPQFEGPNIEAEKGLPSVVSEGTTKFALPASPFAEALKCMSTAACGTVLSFGTGLAPFGYKRLTNYIASYNLVLCGSHSDG